VSWPVSAAILPANRWDGVLLDALRFVEKRGAVETVHSLRQAAGQVFRYAVRGFALVRKLENPLSAA
jgi:hypothetical protein